MLENVKKIIEEFMEREGLDLADYNCTMEELCDRAYMLTQYENGGIFDFEDYCVEFFEDNYDIYDLTSYYADYANYDDEIFSMDSFDEILEGYTPSDIANKIHFGKYNPFDPYFKFDGYANIETGEFGDSADLEGFRKYLIENAEDYNELSDLAELKEDKEIYILCAEELVNNGY